MIINIRFIKLNTSESSSVSKYGKIKRQRFVRRHTRKLKGALQKFSPVSKINFKRLPISQSGRSRSTSDGGIYMERLN